ncbi:MAG: dihydrofolate reductase family protein, partial [Mariprofundaceae bacterium]|nr:dihydrofolate reductase family protein [Mariprofundaceae bacterium]
AAGEVLIYSNFIASLDGRISMPDAHGGQGVPASLANKRDWRLYQELAAQADIMLTSARYFRQLAEGCAQDLLPVGRDAAYADLVHWREQHGLKPQPDVAILSRSLDIPQAALDKIQDRRLLVLSTEYAAEKKVAALSAQGVDVIRCAGSDVNGADARDMLIRKGYRSAYMIAGPAVHATIASSGALDELFLTTRHRLLAGDDFSTIMQGPAGQPVGLELVSMHFDAIGEQSFSRYRARHRPRGG